MEVAVVMEAAAGARWRTESPAVGGERARTRERTALRVPALGQSALALKTSARPPSLL